MLLSSNCASWTGKCRLHLSKLHFVEFKWTWTRTCFAHSTFHSAGHFHLTCIMSIMIVLQLHLYCTPCRINADLLKTHCTIPGLRTFPAHVICTKCIPAAVNLQLVIHLKRYSAVFLQNRDLCSAAQIYFISYCVNSSRRTVILRADLRKK